MARPVGSTVSEVDKIVRSKVAWNATADKARRGLDMIADKILEQLAGGTIEPGVAAETLRNVALAATRVTESLIKAEKAYAESPEHTETEEAIMDELAGGGRS